MAGLQDALEHPTRSPYWSGRKRSPDALEDLTRSPYWSGRKRSPVVVDAKRSAAASSEYVPDAAGFNEHVESLTESQRRFVHLLHEWFRKGRPDFFVAIVSGGPGCGKTHAVVETLRHFRANVLKMAPTARLASSFGGRTVHSALGLGYAEGTVLHDVASELRCDRRIGSGRRRRGGKRRRVEREEADYEQEDDDEEEEEEEEEDVARCLATSNRLRNEFSSRYTSPPPDVIVLDEVSMIPFWFVYQIACHFRDLGRRRLGKDVAFVCMGDENQLRPVDSRLNVLDFPFEKYFPSTVRLQMRESKRFVPGYEKIVNRLRELMTSDREKEEEDEEEEDDEGGESGANSKTRDDDPFFAYVRETFPVKECITLSLLSQTTRVLAYRNETVSMCNDYYVREKLICRPMYEFPTIGVPGERRPTLLRQDCSVIVTENGCGTGVFNGTRLVFRDYDAERDEAVCEREEERQRRLCPSPVRVGRSRRSGKIPLVPGFATTVHKYQGGTIDEKNVVMCFDGSADKNLVYTALSRVRKIDQILAVIL